MALRDRILELIDDLPETDALAALEQARRQRQSFYQRATDEEWSRFVESFGADITFPGPPPSDLDIRREAFYEDFPLNRTA